MSYGSAQLETMIPANTRVSVELLSPISTQTAQKGDRFSCKVLTPAEFAGAVIEGHIRSVKRSGKANKDSKLDLAFDRMITTEGKIGDFNATVVQVFDLQKIADDGRADNEGMVRTNRPPLRQALSGPLFRSTHRCDCWRRRSRRTRSRSWSCRWSWLRCYDNVSDKGF